MLSVFNFFGLSVFPQQMMMMMMMKTIIYGYPASDILYLMLDIRLGLSDI